MIDIIELNLMEYGISYNRIDGQWVDAMVMCCLFITCYNLFTNYRVSPHERQRLVDTFNSAAKSPEVGRSVGLWM